MTLLEDAEWSAWSDREIARRCAVDNSTVSRMRASLLQCDSEPSEPPTPRTYTTKHGTTATMNTANIGKARTARLPRSSRRGRAGHRPSEGGGSGAVRTFKGKLKYRDWVAPPGPHRHDLLPRLRLPQRPRLARPTWARDSWLAGIVIEGAARWAGWAWTRHCDPAAVGIACRVRWPGPGWASPGRRTRETGLYGRLRGNLNIGRAWRGQGGPGNPNRCRIAIGVTDTHERALTVSNRPGKPT